MDKNGENMIVKDIGRYGPYLRCGKLTRKISPPDDILSLTLERAVEILSSKQSNTEILKELGSHDGMLVQVKEER